MKSAFSPQVEAVLTQICLDTELLSSDLFRLKGQQAELTRGAAHDSLLGLVEADLLHALTHAFYVRYYIHGGQAPPTAALAGDDLVERLSAANRSSGGWELGWVVVGGGRNGEHVRVESGHELRMLPPSALRKAGVSPSGRQIVDIRREAADIDSQTGYFIACGGTWRREAQAFHGTRIYINICADSAMDWLQQLTRLFEHYAVPYQIKLPRYSNAYARIDSLVIYLERPFADFAMTVIAALPLASRIQDGRVPVFTKQVAHGISIADNPPTGMSFGVSRMRLIAEAIALAHHIDGSRRPLPLIRARFLRAGLNPALPWLNPGNADYEFRTANFSRALRPFESRDRWLAVADDIGNRLVRDAIWSGDQCIWLGAKPSGPHEPFMVGPTGPDFYSGTAGIGLFLMHLAVRTGDPLQRATALGAFRHCMRMVTAPGAGLGAYSGLGGALRTAAELHASGLEEGDVSRKAIRTILDTISRHAGSPDCHDILNGSAGAVRALLYAAVLLPELGSELVALAQTIGEDILARAIPAADGLAWQHSHIEASAPLTGYSHGNAGIACALGQLFACTGSHAFKDAAREAIRYEIAQFDVGMANWPDFRSSSNTQGTRFEQAWCHGAPGSLAALAYLLEFGILDSVEIADVFEAATRTLVESVSRLAPDDSFCLCHGAAGNADILLSLGRQFGREPLVETARKVGREGADRFADTGLWPSGLPARRGDCPSLLLGRAGIGHFYLRLADSQLVSAIAL